MQRFVTFLQKIELTANKLIFIVCCYIVFIFNYAFFSKTANAITALSEYDTGFLLSVPIFLFSLTLLFISLFSIRILVKPVLIFIVLSSAILFYASATYGVVFDYGMVQNTVETDSAEALTYVNFYAIVFIVVLGVLPALAIAKVKVVEQPILGHIIQRTKLIALSLILITIIAGLYYSNYAAVGRNNRGLTKYIVPFTAYVATYKYMRNHYFSPPLPFTFLDNSPKLLKIGGSKSVTVFVVGETARASSFSLNGYDKSTNRYTEKQSVISFSNVSSCGTATAVSVPCMFSRLSRNNYNKIKATSQQNVLDILKLAQVDVLWVDNNSSCKGVCQRVETIKIDTDEKHKYCDGEYCFDEVLLEPLSKKLENITNNNTLIVLHMIGSHGPTYYRRYPNEQAGFLPDCQRSDIQNCSEGVLMNTYDNTIVYTDFVLSKIIEKLAKVSTEQDIKTNMLYVSDHGESLGENGVYLHGLPYIFAPSEQTHIPMIYWQDNQVDIDKNCLSKNAAEAYSHDNIFDSILGLLSVDSTAYQEENDIFAKCRTHYNVENAASID